MFSKKKKKKKQALPKQEPFKSVFNSAALKEELTAKRNGFEQFGEKFGYMSLIIGLCTLEPLNLFWGMYFIFNGRDDRAKVKQRNRITFEEKFAHWTTKSGQRVEGTPYQRALYDAAQSEIFRIQANMDKTHKTHEHEEGEASIKDIELTCLSELSNVKVLSAPEGVSKDVLTFARHFDKPKAPGARLPI